MAQTNQNLDIKNIDFNNYKSYLQQLARLQAALNKDVSVGVVINQTKKLTGSYATFAQERLADIESSYSLMCDYMLKGFKDDHREQLYRQLACRLQSLILDMSLAMRKKYDGAFSQLQPSQRAQVINTDDLKRQLEAFVSDSALLSLEGSTAKEKLQALYAQRHANLTQTFLQIITSSQWNRDVSADMQRIILSPTIDMVDALVLTSATMMAALLVPDAGKVRALIHIFEQAEDVRLRQRAFVGWVFALSAADYHLYYDVVDEVKRLIANEDVRNDLVELQMQTIYCMNAERDRDTIQNDVLPTLMKNQNIEITKFGIKEKMDDPMEDILHSDEMDKKMEAMEASVQKMIDMQKQGADIYFGGFSQMKRFSFFYTLCNWFMPFYVQHPQLKDLSEQLKGSRFMQSLLSTGPFCDSDKYSFALALARIFDRLPAEIREMINNSQAAVMAQGVDETQMESASFIRRQYLQDLYRFFRLNDNRQAFFNPFEEKRETVFLDNALFKPMLHDEATRIDRFLLKRRLFPQAEHLFYTFYDAASADDILIKASLEMHHQQYAEAEHSYQQVLKAKPECLQALKGVALSAFYAGHYDLAATHYQLLAEKYPDKPLYQLNYAISLINAHKEEEGVKLLYELYYNQPDSLNVKRALAWGLLFLKQVGKAAKLYDDILKDNEKTDADYLNAGYCAWFGGRLDDAVALFKHVGNISAKLKEDKSLLEAYAVSHTDQLIMEGLADSK